MIIAILGASGVLGRSLTRQLTARAHTVRLLVRDPATAALANAKNVEIQSADIFDVASLERGFDGCSIVVNAASAVPRPGSSQNWNANTRIRTEGTKNVVAAAYRAGINRVVHQSIAMVHQSVKGAWVDESCPLVETRQTQSAVDLERIVTEGKVDWQIVRGGLFYGPGTGREDYYRRAARAGRIALPGDGSDFLSPIHIEDMAAAIVSIIEATPAPGAWLAVDDRPITWRTFLSHFCILEDRPMPKGSIPNPLPSFRCRNDRLRGLGWRPRYPDYTTGIA